MLLSVLSPHRPSREKNHARDGMCPPRLNFEYARCVTTNNFHSPNPSTTSTVTLGGNMPPRGKKTDDLDPPSDEEV